MVVAMDVHIIIADLAGDTILQQPSSLMYNVICAETFFDVASLSWKFFVRQM